MMKACGIIAEYNPFHEGHKYHIQKSKEQSNAEVMIAVMSGNFVQRGEPAIVDKWTRAEAAVRNGIDLVIELPYIYATQSATKFAHGGVSLLKLANVDVMSFGSECGNLENLIEIAETPINPDHLHQAMKSGMSFPQAYSLLTHEMQPNDILAVSYLKELQGSSVKPMLVQRTSDYLEEELTDVPSASALRAAVKKGLSLPEGTPMKQILEDCDPVFLERYYPYIRTCFLLTKPKTMEKMFLINEGIENHLRECAKSCNTYEEFLNKAVTCRYTAGRIRRSILQAIAQVEKEEVAALGEVHYLRVLAFNDTGRAYLKELRKQEAPVAHRFADMPLSWRELEYRTTCLYTSVLDPENRQRILQDEIGGPRYIR